MFNTESGMKRPHPGNQNEEPAAKYMANINPFALMTATSPPSSSHVPMISAEYLSLLKMHQDQQQLLQYHHELTNVRQSRQLIPTPNQIPKTILMKPFFFPNLSAQFLAPFPIDAPVSSPGPTVLNVPTRTPRQVFVPGPPPAQPTPRRSPLSKPPVVNSKPSYVPPCFENASGEIFTHFVMSVRANHNELLLTTAQKRT